MKKCSDCKVTKHHDEFNKNRSKHDGLSDKCRDCKKAEDRRRRQSSQRFLRRYKQFCGCRICGERDWIVLDLHHLNPDEKDANPSQLIRYSREVLKREIRKCVVLCSNCHRRVHAGTVQIG